MNSLEGLYYGFSVALTTDEHACGYGRSDPGDLCGRSAGYWPAWGPGHPADGHPLGATSDSHNLIGGRLLRCDVWWVNNLNTCQRSRRIRLGSHLHGRLSHGEAGASGCSSRRGCGGSVLAGTAGVIILMLVAPPLARLALALGYPEYFAIALLGLFALSRLSSGSFWRSIVVLAFGLMLSTVGMDSVSGALRYTFGINALGQGVEIISVAMGLYGVGEVLIIAEQSGGLPQITTFKFRGLLPTRREWNRSLPAIARGTGARVILGLIPGRVFRVRICVF